MTTQLVTPAQVLAAQMAVDLQIEDGQQPDPALVAIAKAEPPRVHVFPATAAEERAEPSAADSAKVRPATARKGVAAPARQGREAAGGVMVKPLEDHILVLALQAKQSTASGPIVQDTLERPQEGKVLATGPGRVDESGNRVPLDVSEGDVVIFSKYGGTEVKGDGKDLLLLNARDILAVVTK